MFHKRQRTPDPITFAAPKQDDDDLPEVEATPLADEHAGHAADDDPQGVRVTRATIRPPAETPAAAGGTPETPRGHLPPPPVPPESLGTPRTMAGIGPSAQPQPSATRSSDPDATQPSAVTDPLDVAKTTPRGTPAQSVPPPAPVRSPLRLSSIPPASPRSVPEASVARMTFANLADMEKKLSRPDLSDAELADTVGTEYRYPTGTLLEFLSLESNLQGPVDLNRKQRLAAARRKIVRELCHRTTPSDRCLERYSRFTLDDLRLIASGELTYASAPIWNTVDRQDSWLFWSHHAYRRVDEQPRVPEDQQPTLIQVPAPVIPPPANGPASEPPIPAGVPLPWRTRLGRWIRTHKKASMALGCIAAAALGMGTWRLATSPSTPSKKPSATDSAATAAPEQTVAAPPLEDRVVRGNEMLKECGYSPTLDCRAVNLSKDGTKGAGRIGECVRAPVVGNPSEGIRDICDCKCLR